MVCVDTSVWAASFRKATGVEARELKRLLDEDQVLLPVPVRVEILSGASGRDRARLRRVLGALPHAYPSEATWTRMETWIDQAGASGQRFGMGDLLIASIASDRSASVWSLDDDFARMEALDFIESFHPQ